MQSSALKIIYTIKKLLVAKQTIIMINVDRMI